MGVVCGGILFIDSPNGPGEEGVSLKVWDLRHQPEGIMSNSWWAGCKGSPVMTLVYLRQEDLVMPSRGGRGQAIIFWEVLITLYAPFLFSVMAPMY